MIIKAQFTGTPSLGYVPGRVYKLKINQQTAIWIERFDGTGLCPYSSFVTFLENWTNIKVLDTFPKIPVIKNARFTGRFRDDKTDLSKFLEDQSVTAEFKNIPMPKNETLESGNARKRLNSLLNHMTFEGF